MLAACSGQAAPDPGCPAYASAVVHADPKSPSQWADNAKQCERYWISRFASVQGPASEAVEAAMYKCFLERTGAYNALPAAQQAQMPYQSYLQDNRRDLLTVAIERRYHQCEPPAK
jgi:hypothetical protein